MNFEDTGELIAILENTDEKALKLPINKENVSERQKRIAIAKPKTQES